MTLAIITGASRGIGLAMARRLLGQGMEVLAIARDEAALQAARDSLGALGARYQPGRCDVRDAACLDALCTDSIAQHGAPALVIACAGVARPGGFLDVPLAAHEDAIGINYLGTLNLVRACLPAMVASRRGRLLLVSSAAALGSFYGFTAYTPSKAAVRALGDALALEVAPLGVSVTVGFPPDTDTPQLRGEVAHRPAVTRAYLEGAPVLSAEVVAEALLDATAAGRRYAAPGAGPRMMLTFPVLTDWIGRWRQSRLALRLGGTTQQG